MTNKASNSRPPFRVIAVSWREQQAALSLIRRRVFIEEQHVPEPLEWDGLDDIAQHVLALDADDRPIGCGRLLPEGRIGRMAVLPDWRGQGIGHALLQRLLQLARSQDCREITLSAQVAAIPFYQKAGFQVCSGTYMDAGIPHRDMRLALST